MAQDNPWSLETAAAAPPEGSFNMTAPENLQKPDLHAIAANYGLTPADIDKGQQMIKSGKLTQADAIQHFNDHVASQQPAAPLAIGPTDEEASNAISQQRGGWEKPLLSYIDSQTGTKLADSYQPAPSAMDILKYKGGMETARQTLAGQSPASAESKAAQDFYRAMLNKVEPGAGSMITDQMSKAMLEKEGGPVDAYIKGKLGAQGMQMKMAGLTDTKNNSLNNTVIQEFSNHPQLKRVQAQLDQTETDLQTLRNPSVVLTPQTYSELEKGLANALSGGGGSALGSQEKVEFQNLHREVAKALGRVSSVPQDANTPEYRKLLQEGFQRLHDRYEDLRYETATRLQQQKTGITKGNPGFEKALQQGADAYKPQPRAAAPVAPAGAGIPVEADLSKLTPGQLQEYIKTHGGQGD